MCTVCGLPTTHSNLTQTLGILTLLSFSITTFLGAWLIITELKLRGALQRLHTLFSLKKKPK
jgi:hypothetical protein